jgi:hypothetical protein
MVNELVIEYSAIVIPISDIFIFMYLLFIIDYIVV